MVARYPANILPVTERASTFQVPAVERNIIGIQARDHFGIFKLKKAE
jgi:hypothetical protein